MTMQKDLPEGSPGTAEPGAQIAAIGLVLAFVVAIAWSAWSAWIRFGSPQMTVAVTCGADRPVFLEDVKSWEVTAHKVYVRLAWQWGSQEYPQDCIVREIPPVLGAVTVECPARGAEPERVVVPGAVSYEVGPDTLRVFRDRKKTQWTSFPKDCRVAATIASGGRRARRNGSVFRLTLASTVPLLSPYLLTRLHGTSWRRPT